MPATIRTAPAVRPAESSWSVIRNQPYLPMSRDIRVFAVIARPPNVPAWVCFSSASACPRGETGPSRGLVPVAHQASFPDPPA
jgi:hypothetical protein